MSADEIILVARDYSYTSGQWEAVEAVLKQAGIIPDVVAAGSRDGAREWSRRPKFPLNVAALHAELDVELHMLGSHGPRRTSLAPGRLAARYERHAKQLAAIRQDLEADPLVRRIMPDLTELEKELTDLAASLKRPSRGRPKTARQRREFCLALLRLWRFGFKREVTSYRDGDLIRFMCAAAAPAGQDYPLTERACQAFIRDHRHLLDRLDLNEYIQLQDLFDDPRDG